MADRLLLVVQVLSLLGAALPLLGLAFPPSAVEGVVYTWTYPDGTVAAPTPTPEAAGILFGDMLVAIVTSIYLLALGACIFMLRRIGAFLRERG